MGVYDSNIKRDVEEINKLLRGVEPIQKEQRSFGPLQRITFGAPGTG